ncbi:hypothetical protein RUM44_006067 [Polyplax serrata]|uniref:Uncharacterized protein n=1 Tax=Polyplax serrata TaxID=468196 RepID=A0ABR1AYV2_POLSC
MFRATQRRRVGKKLILQIVQHGPEWKTKEDRCGGGVDDDDGDDDDDDDDDVDVDVVVRLNETQTLACN